MAHAHAHPPSADHISSLPFNSHMHAHPESRSLPTTPLQFQDPVTPGEQHARRLRLRQAAFRGPLLSGRRVSPPTVPIFHSERNSASYTANSPFIAESKGTRMEEVASAYPMRRSSRGSILQEISNIATNRRVGSPTIVKSSGSQILDPMPDIIYDENTLREHVSPADDTTKMPPSRSRASRSNAGTTSSASSSLPRSLRKSRHGNRSSSSANKYIDHLESELTSTHAKLAELKSPTATRTQSARIRELTKQVQVLREEVTGWEQNYQERVNDEVFARTRIESDLRKTIRGLEEELNAKDTRAKELERDLDIIRDRLRESQASESNLGRRVDTLTGLLVQSPTRSETSAANSPTFVDGIKRTPRPRSMMLPRPSPYIETSQTSADSGFVSHNTFPSHAQEADSAGSHNDTNLSGGRHASISSAAPSTNGPTLPSQSAFSSRPTSMISTSSATSWDLPIPPETRPKLDAQARKMRRFVSGSRTLKPLLLPSASGTPVLPASASPDHDSQFAFLDSPSSPTSRDDQTLTPEVISRLRRNMGHSSSDSGSTRRYSRATINQPSLWTELQQARPDSVSSLASEMRDQDPLSPTDSGRTLKHRPPFANLNELMMESSPTLAHQARRQYSLTSEIESDDDATDINMSPQPLRIRRARARSDDCSPTPGAIKRLQNLVASFKHAKLLSVRDILFRSLLRGSSLVDGLAWWIIGLTPRMTSVTVPVATLGPRKDQVECPKLADEADRYVRSMTWPSLFPVSSTCPHCSEPPSRRSLRLWSNFSLALVLAIGVAVLDGPGALLPDEGQDHLGRLKPRLSSVQLAYRRRSEEMKYEIELERVSEAMRNDRTTSPFTPPRQH